MTTALKIRNEFLEQRRPMFEVLGPWDHVFILIKRETARTAANSQNSRNIQNMHIRHARHAMHATHGICGMPTTHAMRSTHGTRRMRNMGTRCGIVDVPLKLSHTGARSVNSAAAKMSVASE